MSSPIATASTSSAPAPAAYEPDAILLRFDATPDMSMDPYGDTPADDIDADVWYLPGPDFTLYGDGTVIYRNDAAERAAEPNLVGRSAIGPSLRTVRLSDAQVAEVLDFAWREGGLADALPRYAAVATGGRLSATLEILAGDRAKRVAIEDLTPAPPETRQRLLDLIDYLRNIDSHLGVESQPWAPERFWAGLQTVDLSFVGPAENEWPWQHLQPEGWVGGRRSLTASEVAALGLGPVPGGYCCALVAPPGGDDGTPTAYGISLAPALPDAIVTDAVAEVVTNALVIRNAPGTGEDSDILDGRLNAPQLLYVADGPVSADGFDWYLVEPFGYDYLPSDGPPAGWVAAGSDEGEPWIAPQDLSCQQDLDSLVRLSAMTRLMCLGNEEFALQGTHGDCFINDPDGAPAWLLSRGCALLYSGYDQGVTPAPAPLIMRIESLTSTSTSLSGTWVYVTGHFDDPAAAECAAGQNLDRSQHPLLAALACRTQFVATSIRDTPPTGG